MISATLCAIIAKAPVVRYCLSKAFRPFIGPTELGSTNARHEPAIGATFLTRLVGLRRSLVRDKPPKVGHKPLVLPLPVPSPLEVRSLVCPAMACDRPKCFNRCSGWTPGGEEGEIAIGATTTDQQTAGPETRICVV